MTEVQVDPKGPFIGFGGQPFMVLVEQGGNRICHINVDILVGGAMSSEMIQHVVPNRPTPYRLFCNLVDNFGAVIEKVVVREMINNIFRAVICLTTKDGSVMELDSRPSDAVLIAFIKKCPVFINEQFLNEDKIGVRARIAAAEREINQSLDNAPSSGTMTDEEAKRFLEGFDPDKIPKA